MRADASNTVVRGSARRTRNRPCEPVVVDPAADDDEPGRRAANVTFAPAIVLPAAVTSPDRSARPLPRSNAPLSVIRTGSAWVVRLSTAASGAGSPDGPAGVATARQTYSPACVGFRRASSSRSSSEPIKVPSRWADGEAVGRIGGVRIAGSDGVHRNEQLAGRAERQPPESGVAGRAACRAGRIDGLEGPAGIDGRPSDVHNRGSRADLRSGTLPERGPESLRHEHDELRCLTPGLDRDRRPSCSTERRVRPGYDQVPVGRGRDGKRRRAHGYGKDQATHRSILAGPDDVPAPRSGHARTDRRRPAHARRGCRGTRRDPERPPGSPRFRSPRRRARLLVRGLMSHRLGRSPSAGPCHSGAARTSGRIDRRGGLR